MPTDRPPRTGPTDGGTGRAGARRRFLRLAASVSAVGLAGCATGGGPGPVTATDATATSMVGGQRTVAGLASKETAEYRPYPNGDQRCFNCRYYNPDEDGDGYGTCDLVAGRIDPAGWCRYYYGD